MSTYENHCNSLVDDAREDYWDKCYEEEMKRQLGHLSDRNEFPMLIRECRKNARAYANAMLSELDDHDLDVSSDWKV